MSGFDNDVVYAKNADFTQADNQNVSESNGLITDGQLWIGTTALNAGGTHINVGTLTAGTGITITNGPGNITVASTAASTDLHAARYIVSAGGLANGANYTTIASAYAAAVAAGGKQTVFIQPGTYTENLTMTPNVNLSAFGSDSSSNGVGAVIISGTLTLTTAGTVTVSGIQLQTNSAPLLTVSGSAASIVNLNNCFLNCTNNTGISHTSSNAASAINLSYCDGNIGTTGIALFASTSTGNIDFNYCDITNSGGSSTASTISAATVTLRSSGIRNPITTSSVAGLGLFNSFINTGAQNVTALTVGGSLASIAFNSTLFGGSASAISVGASANLLADLIVVDSSNTNAITGAGTLSMGGISFSSSSSTINTTTQAARVFNPGSLQQTIAAPGATTQAIVSNTSNTASSNALIQTTVAGTSAGDAVHTYTVTGTTNWSQGIDNSVTGDPFVLAASTALGTTNVMSAATTGEVNWPLQPAFSAYVSAPIANVTGNGTNYTIIFDTEVFDQNGDYNNATGVFTAPVTGRYDLRVFLTLDDMTIACTNNNFAYVTSNRNYNIGFANLGTLFDAATALLGLQMGAVVADMDVGDTASTRISVSGTTLTVDVHGAASMQTYFTGGLLW